MANQNLYPNIIMNPVKNLNTVVNAQSLPGGTLSSLLDLQAHRTVKGLCTPTAANNYFLIDPITGAPIQLGRGDIVISMSLYGPELAGGTDADIGVSIVPTFSADGVPTTPTAPLYSFLAAPIALLDLQAGINATLVATTPAAGSLPVSPTLPSATAQWLTVVTTGTFTAGSLGVVLQVSNPGAALV